MAAFLKDAILLENTALSGTEDDLRNFHRRIGSNLSLIEPQGETGQARTSKERAEPSSSRHGGVAARDSFRPHSIPTSSRMTKAGKRSEEEAEHDSEVASPAVTSDAADVSAASVVSLAHVAGSRHPSSFVTPGRRSSSRWAERPVPVLRVVFPEPWGIIAAARFATATGSKNAGNPKWSGRLDLNQRLLRPERSALPG